MVQNSKIYIIGSLCFIFAFLFLFLVVLFHSDFESKEYVDLTNYENEKDLKSRNKRSLFQIVNPYTYSAETSATDVPSLEFSPNSTETSKKLFLCST